MCYQIRLLWIMREETVWLIVDGQNTIWFFMFLICTVTFYLCRVSWNISFVKSNGIRGLVGQIKIARIHRGTILPGRARMGLFGWRSRSTRRCAAPCVIGQSPWLTDHRRCCGFLAEGARRSSGPVRARRARAFWMHFWLRDGTLDVAAWPWRKLGRP